MEYLSEGAYIVHDLDPMMQVSILILMEYLSEEAKDDSIRLVNDAKFQSLF